MKSWKILLVMLGVFLILGTTWVLWPKDGVKVGDVTLRFPSYAEASMPDTVSKVNVDSVLESVQESFIMTCSDSQRDSLNYFKEFLTQNPNRIYLPNDDYTFLDSLFYQMEHAKEEGVVYRVMHYGDSQIEMDRISSVLRERLQGMFGGEGVGMMPAVQNIPTVSISQRANGGLTRYILYGDSTTRRAPHSKYGVMGHFSELNGSATINFKQSSHSHATKNVKQWQKVSLLIGDNSEGFSATLKCDTFGAEKRICAEKEGITMLTWKLPTDVKKGSLQLEGRANVYAILLDSCSGVAVDNNPLRGCSGTIFSRIESNSMAQSFRALNTRLIILQFGGNRMPSISTPKTIHAYMEQIEKQINYFKRVSPESKILFIGPSDMGKSVDGQIGTWPHLPELNDSLKATALRNEVAYWDMFHVMGGENSMVRWVRHSPAFATSDYIHFTHQGAMEIGNVLAKSFEIYYDFYKLRQRLSSDDVIEFISDGDSIRSERSDSIEMANDTVQ